MPDKGAGRVSDMALLTHIKAIHAETRGAYGWPRIWRELRQRGVRVGKERVRKMMRDNAIRARSKRKYKATTDSNHGLPVSDNLLNRNFQPERPDLVWTGDITYIATQEGWLYLAVVIDLFSRQVVGWAMGKRMTRHLVIDALTMAWFRRRPAEGLIFHSDQGSQYASSDFQATLRGYAMRGSMSRKGNCWDNRGDGNSFRFVEGRAASRHALRNAAPGPRRGHRLACLLQPEEGCIRPWATRAPWRSRKIGVASKRHWRHKSGAMGGAARGQGHFDDHGAGRIRTELFPDPLGQKNVSVFSMPMPNIPVRVSLALNQPLYAEMTVVQPGAYLFRSIKEIIYMDVVKSILRRNFRTTAISRCRVDLASSFAPPLT